MLQKRPNSGIWGGLWAPPEFEDEIAARGWIARTLSLSPDDCRINPPFVHTFTHFKLEAHPIRVHCETSRAIANDVEYVARPTMVLSAPVAVGWLTRTDRAVADRAEPRNPIEERLMARTVQCRRYNEELEGLERAPLPGAKGQDIFDNVSKKAWLEWQGHQTMLIKKNISA